MRAFDKGQRDSFVTLCTKNIPEKIRTSDPTAQNIEFFVHVYFAIYPIKHKTGVSEGISDMANMRTDRNVLNSRHQID